jgi:hypothetical protein
MAETETPNITITGVEGAEQLYVPNQTKKETQTKEEVPNEIIPPTSKSYEDAYKAARTKEIEIGLKTKEEEQKQKIRETEQRLAREKAAQEAAESARAIIAPVATSPEAIKAEQAAYKATIKNKELQALQTQEALINQQRRIEQSRRDLAASKTNTAVNTVKQAIAGVSESIKPNMPELLGQVAPAQAAPPASVVVETAEGPKNTYQVSGELLTGVGGTVSSAGSKNIVEAVGDGYYGPSTAPNNLLINAGGTSQQNFEQEARNPIARKNLLTEIGGTTPYPQAPEPFNQAPTPQPTPQPVQVQARPVPIPITPPPTKPPIQVPVLARPVQAPVPRPVPTPIPKAPKKIKAPKIPKTEKLYVPKVPKPIVVPVVVEAKAKVEKKVHHEGRGRPRQRGRPTRAAQRERARRAMQKLEKERG